MRLGGAAVLAAGLMLLVTACAAIDADPQSRVNAALKAARIDHVAPIWDGQRNELRLRGVVVDADEKRQAEQVAASVLNGRGTIVNEITVTLRGAPQAAPVVAEAEDLERIDERIHRDVEALFADKTVWKGREFHILVRGGSVRLTGTALSQEDKDRITEMVARVAGVKDVINRLDLKQQT
ncbi:MAG TPA: BON domain-containing protein [Vicinamibacterales bacterium]|nr:BON domain-containing protein [Vicinamibacterales bacterium]